MRWIVLAIVAYAGVSTAVNFAYRKPGKPHEPAAEAGQRHSRIVHATMAGWVRLAAALQEAPPTEEPPPALGAPPAPVRTSPAPSRLDRVLPFDLVAIVPRQPALHDAIEALEAPSTVSADRPLRLVLRVRDAERAPRFGEVLAYARGGCLHVFVQDDTRLAPGSAPVAATPRLALELRADSAGLAPGRWAASLHAAETTFAWEFTVDAVAPQEPP
jgi:hypothetical protein